MCICHFLKNGQKVWSRVNEYFGNYFGGFYTIFIFSLTKVEKNYCIPKYRKKGIDVEMTERPVVLAIDAREVNRLQFYH